MSEEKRNVTIVINGKEVTNTIASINRSYRSQRKELNGLQIGTDKYKRKVAELARTKGILDQHRAQIRGVKNEYRGATKGAGGFGSMLGGGLKSSLGALVSPVGLAAAGIGALIGGFVSGVQKAREFNVALDELQAITGANGDEITKYKAKALETSAAVGMSAVAIVDAYKLVGSARPQLLQNSAALTDFTQKAIVLSQATKDELGPTVASLTNIMAANSAETAQAERYINALAAGSQKGAKPVGFLSDALEKVGPAAKSANIEIEQQIAIMETLGEKGIPQASTAGTNFRNILLELQKDVGNYTDGQFDMNKALANMEPIMNDSVALTDKFGKENVVAAQILAQNVGRIDELTEAVTGTNTAYEQQATNTDNLDSAMGRLSAKWDAIILKFSDGEGIIVFLVDHVGDYLTVFGEFLSEMGSLFGDLYDSISELVTELFSFVDVNTDGIEMIDIMRLSFRAMTTPIKLVIAALTSFIDTIIFLRQVTRQNLVEIVNNFGVWYNGIASLINKMPGVKIKGAFIPLPVVKADVDKYKEKIAANFDGIFTVKPVVDDSSSVDVVDDKDDKDEENGDPTGGGERVMMKTIERIEGEDNFAEGDLLQTEALINAARLDMNQEFLDNVAAQNKEARDKQQALDLDKERQLQDFKNEMWQLAANTAGTIIAGQIAQNEQREIQSLQIKKDQGLISEAEFEKQREAIAKKAFKKKQALDTAQAIVNGALAVTKVTAQTGVLSPFAIPAIIAQTAAQIAVINSQKYESGGTYNPLSGRSHANGGNPILDPNTGAKIGEIEQGEFIIRKNRVNAQTLPLLRAINSGGIQEFDFQGHNKFMKWEKGGMFEESENQGGPTESEALTLALQEIGGLRRDFNKWNREFTVVMKYSQIEDADHRQNTVKKIANIRA